MCFCLSTHSYLVAGQNYRLLHTTESTTCHHHILMLGDKERISSPYLLSLR